jgi:hypothetical protein
MGHIPNLRNTLYTLLNTPPRSAHSSIAATPTEQQQPNGTPSASTSDRFEPASNAERQEPLFNPESLRTRTSSVEGLQQLGNRQAPFNFNDVVQQLQRLPEEEEMPQEEPPLPTPELQRRTEQSYPTPPTV